MKIAYLSEGDNFALELHHRIADRLRIDPSLIEIAKSNMNRWLQNEPSWSSRITIEEWQDMIEELSLEDLIAEMLKEDDEGQRIRSNSPFCGIISQDESKEILDLAYASYPS
jgi:hypothetical protein